MAQQGETFARILVDKALTDSGWNLLDKRQVRVELNMKAGRADYVLFDSRGRAICVLEAKAFDRDPYDAKNQARGYAENLSVGFVLLSNGNDHWFWDLNDDSKDAYRIERLPSPTDLERMVLRTLNPPRPLSSEAVGRDYLATQSPNILLRQYQVDAVRTVSQQFDDQRRSFLIEMATGTGKTLLCAAIIRAFLKSRNAERILFIVDRTELARQTLEDFSRTLAEYSPVLYKSARRTGELLGSSVVVATIQSLMTDRRYREEFTPFYFDLVINDEAHRSIYGDARQAVQFFQGCRLGLTATPKAYLRNIDTEKLANDDPKKLEARELRDTYRYFDCEPGFPTFRYDMLDAVKDPEGPFLCLPRIIDCRSDITTDALKDAGWTVRVNEQEESYKVSDLEKKVFTPHRNRVMCETFLQQAQRDPSGQIGRSIVFAVNQRHATEITKTLNDLRPGLAVTITSRVDDATRLAKDFRDGRSPERVAVSVDMLSTGYNCPNLLNVVLMRPVFSPVEYVQIKGRGTRLYTFEVDNLEYEKKQYYLIDFCAVAEYFEEHYDYTAPLALPARGVKAERGSTSEAADSILSSTELERELGRRETPVWEGVDRMISTEVRVVGPEGEKVDAMTFRGAFERELRDFVEADLEMAAAVQDEDDDGVERLMQQRFFHQPTMYYAPDKLVLSYGVPAPTAAFVYGALGVRPLPDRQTVVADTVEYMSARFNLRYNEQRLLKAVVQLIGEDETAFGEFSGGQYTQLFRRSQFRPLGGVGALARLENRAEIFEALAQSAYVECIRMVHKDGEVA